MISDQDVTGYTNTERQRVGVVDPELVLEGIVLDAELALATPERLW